MSSEEFRVSTSGPSISFFLYEAVNRPVDFEGLLFGDYQRCLHREISDQADAGDQNRPATIIHDVHIRRIVPTGGRYSFYDRRFNANMPDFVGNVVKEMSSSNQDPRSGPGSHASRPTGSASSSNQSGTSTGENSQTLVRSGFLGWFRYQKCPPQYHSSELFICRALSSPNALKGFPVLKDGADTGDLSCHYPWPGHGPFYLFAHPGNKNNILEWGMQLKVFNSTTKQFRSIRLNIRNLGDTTHADYWKVSDDGGAAAAGIDGLLPGIVSPDFSKRLVEETDQMAENAKRHLSTAFEQAVAATTRTFHHFLGTMKDAPAHLSTKPASYYVKYGYAPSDQESVALVDHLRSSIGSKGDGNGAVEYNASQDLFDCPNASVAAANVEREGGDTAKEDGDWQMVSTADASATSAIVEKASSMNISDSEIDFPELPSQPPGFENVTQRGSKRPKDNTSGSSSGANSDEMSESPATNGKNSEISATSGQSSGTSTPKVSANTVKAHMTLRASVPAQQGNAAGSDREKTNNQQQRKKSKSSDSGSSGAESHETVTPVSAPRQSPAASMGSQRMVRPSTPASTVSNSSMGSGRGSPLSGSAAPPIRPSKGRGDRWAKDVSAPPGFNHPKP